MSRTYAAGAGAVATIEDSHTNLSLENRGARCLAVDPENPDTVYAGTTDEGLFKSDDGGRNWERLSGIPHPRVTSVAVSPVDGAVYAGTEPSSLFVSRDGGGSWRELERMKDLPSAPRWSFPPRPWTSHVRAISPSHEDPDLILVGIELGGVLRSTDGGETWQDQRPGAQADCHSLATHPAVPQSFYEAGGGGFAESEDFGDSWKSGDDGLELRYTWGLAVDGEDPDLVYISAASGPMRAHGRGFTGSTIYRRKAEGRWTPILEKLPEFPYALATDAERPGSLYAGFGDGKIHFKPGPDSEWRELGRVPKEVQALVVISS